MTLSMVSVAMAALLAAASVAMATAAPARAACAPQCLCVHTIMSCAGKGLTELPEGAWPHVMVLDVSSNAISNIDALGRRFPTLVFLRMGNNALTSLDLNALAGPDAPVALQVADVSRNRIASVVAPPEGTRLNQLSTLFLNSNRISSLDRDTFRALPNLKRLALNNNPLVVPPARPLLSHHLLLELDLTGVDASALSESTFAELPSLVALGLENTGVRRVDGVFNNLQALETILLQSNDITEIAVGSFPPAMQLNHLSLDRNPLLSIDTQALPVADGGELAIDDTPLTCACAHGHVARWAAEHRVTLSADCQDVSACHFDQVRV